MSIRDEEEEVRAILAMKRSVLLAREIAALEAVLDGSIEDDREFIRAYAIDAEITENQSEEAWPEFTEDIADKLRIVESLKVTFSREIADWLNRKDMKRARKVVRNFEGRAK